VQAIDAPSTVDGIAAGGVGSGTTHDAGARAAPDHGDAGDTDVDDGRQR
jgi:hypothetical protein